ncbi:MAG: hypothetical protein JWR70_607 [Modestobacter sp.]|nr:hypothetical protein [Modestobacter sp.]
MTVAGPSGAAQSVGVLSAGPLSGGQVSVWRTRTGTGSHGDRRCPSLARSAPEDHAHSLGTGATIGDLDWPADLHCTLAFTDPGLRQYDDEAVDVARLRDQALAALAAVTAASPDRDRHDREPGAWNWPARAPALAGAVHAPRPLPDDAALARLAQQTTDELTAAARAVRASVLCGPAGASPAPRARAGRGGGPG